VRRIDAEAFLATTESTKLRGEWECLVLCVRD